jgi:hypothetical protein
MKIRHVLVSILFAAAAASCADRDSGEPGAADAGSRSTGERNDRLGNDPAQQNTGRGSTPDAGPAPAPAPAQRQ